MNESHPNADHVAVARFHAVRDRMRIPMLTCRCYCFSIGRIEWQPSDFPPWSHPSLISSERITHHQSPFGCICTTLMSSTCRRWCSSLGSMWLYPFWQNIVLTLHSIRVPSIHTGILLHSTHPGILLHSIVLHSRYMTASHFYWILTSPLLIRRSIIIPLHIRFCRIKHWSNVNRYVIGSQLCKLCVLTKLLSLKLQDYPVFELLATFAWHLLLLRAPESQ